MVSVGIDTILENIDNPNIQGFLKASPDVQRDVAEAKRQALEGHRVAHPEGDASAGILVPVDRGVTGEADEGSGVLHLALSFCEPRTAAGIAIFGLSLAALPLIAKLDAVDAGLEVERVGVREAVGFSYDACRRTRQNEEKPLHADALRCRLGALDPVGLGTEILRSEAEAGEKSRCGDEEIGEIQDAVLRARTSMRRLRRRSALAFMGLSPAASAEEVSQRYKRMALEMHPDKGGDAERFQQLQEMKGRLTKSIQEEEDEEERQRAEEEAKKEELPPTAKAKQLRREAHKEAVRLWDEAREIEEEMLEEKQLLKGDPAPVLARLRSFVESFSNSKCRTLPHGNKTRAQEVFRQFKADGLELIAAAALLDPAGTANLIATHVNYKVVSRSGSKDVAQAAQALLEAVADVPHRVEAFLSAMARERAEARDEEEEHAAAEEELGGPLSAGDEVLVLRAEDGEDNPEEASGTVLGPGGAEGVAVKLESGRRIVVPRARLRKAPPKKEPVGTETTSEAKAAGGYPGGEAQATAKVEGPKLLAKQPEAQAAVNADPVRLAWDPSFGHPYVGAMSGTGDGIFCRACKSWVATRHFAHEAFLRHARAAHPRPPQDWKGPVPDL